MVDKAPVSRCLGRVIPVETIRYGRSEPGDVRFCVSWTRDEGRAHEDDCEMGDGLG